MNPCRQCGAQLPDEAKYCLQCGTEVMAREPQQPLEFVQPALAGGMFLGLLSSLPIVSAGNCLCCMWVLGGGALSTFLLTKQRPTGISYGDGAFGGVLSGSFGAVVATIISIPLRVLSARFLESQQTQMEEYMRQIPEFEGPFRDLMMRLMSPEVSALTISVTFFSNLIMYSLFAMIGGILMVAILQKRKMGS